jgi:ATP-dependent Clp protease ATP-binding subunit ClpX
MIPDDLMRFGMIPELVGRLPVSAVVDPLDEEALRTILTQPRNALVRQYTRLFEMDEVSLEFEEEALVAAAALAMKRETGARGLRSIIEGTLLDVMYEIPSKPEIGTVVVTAAAVRREGSPVMLDREGQELSSDADQGLPDAA